MILTGTWTAEYLPGSGLTSLNIRIKNTTPTTIKGTLDFTASTIGDPGDFTYDKNKIPPELRPAPRPPSRLPPGPGLIQDIDSRSAAPGQTLNLYAEGRLRSGDGARSVTGDLTVSANPYRVPGTTT